MPSSAAPSRPRRSIIQFAAYGPAQLDVLPGQTVLWTNVSPRTHTVTSDDGFFDSGDVASDSRFSFQFNDAGDVPLPLHDPRRHRRRDRRPPSDPRRACRQPRSPSATPVEFDGRTATPGAAGARPAARDGRCIPDGRPGDACAERHLEGDDRRATRPATSAQPRASSASETRRLLVSERKVHVQPTRTGRRSVTRHAGGPLRAVPRRGLPPRALRLVAGRARRAELRLRGRRPRPAPTVAGAHRARRPGRLDAARDEPRRVVSEALEGSTTSRAR